MKPGRFLILCLTALSLAALAGVRTTAIASSARDEFLAAEDYRLESRLRIERDHYRGSSVAEQRSRLYNPSYIRREERRRALSQEVQDRRPLLSDLPADLGDAPCRTMTTVDVVGGRRALVSQRECFDASGIDRVAPGSRRVIRYFDK